MAIEVNKKSQNRLNLSSSSIGDHDSKQIMPLLGHSNAAYKNFSSISIDKKAANASWLKLPSINTLPHAYVIIYKTQKPYLPVCIYEITPFDVSSEIKMNKQLLGGIMKGIGFCPGSDAGKSTGVYSRKAGLSPHQIELDNTQWTKLQKYDKFIYSRISHL
ncbi:hypothetical protein O181_096294 [Austropuccinia psidii MF-1]|uniref:Uncharacterized protein n=1 Tax=Austropuccinia psidii MF-1 TaxID=1389203 RepID=A0A9Q3PCJ1_9BASI|nr:hypothetical protein [Austropuccinia psidii MF-1]